MQLGSHLFWTHHQWSERKGKNLCLFLYWIMNDRPRHIRVRPEGVNVVSAEVSNMRSNACRSWRNFPDLTFDIWEIFNMQIALVSSCMLITWGALNAHLLRLKTLKIEINRTLNRCSLYAFVWMNDSSLTCIWNCFHLMCVATHTNCIWCNDALSRHALVWFNCLCLA